MTHRIHERDILSARHESGQCDFWSTIALFLCKAIALPISALQ
ncbi:hypothetical protein [Altericista sp. CCNU0014]